MDFVKQIVEEKGSELVGGLVAKLGFSAEEAQAFVPEAARSVFGVVQEKAGELDLSDLPASAGTLVDGVDTDGLAAKVGIDPSQAGAGLSAIVPTLLATLQEKAGGLTGLSSMLGGGEGVGKALGDIPGAGGLAGKLFGK